MSLNPQSCVSRRGDVLTSSIGEETVMLDVEKGFYFGLDPVATRIWELLESPVRVADLCTQLVDEFEVTPEACSADVATFLESLRENGLIDIADE